MQSNSAGNFAECRMQMRQRMPETLWHCHVKEFGPLIVSIDSYGKNYFEEKKVEYNKKKDEQIEIISKQVGFIK